MLQRALKACSGTVFWKLPRTCEKHRDAFCWQGIVSFPAKGAAKGQGVYALDTKKQSKQLLRLDAVVTYDKGELAMTWKSSQVKLLEQLPAAKRARTE